MIYAGSSVKGKRNNNEDCIFLPQNSEASLVVLADGMGGHNAGEIASRLAVETAANAILRGGGQKPEHRILGAVENANLAVYEYAASDQNCRGMGTTLVLAMLFRTRFLCANVGDSRLYLLKKDSSLHQITHDHSYVAELVQAGYITSDEARVHPKRNIITRALGTTPNERADLFDCAWENGDTVFLCSDGLYEVLAEDEIVRLLGEEKDLYAACERLTALALDGGSTDNISVVLVKNDEEML